MKRFILGALAYVLITLPLAAGWHVGLFESTYHSLGYFGREQPIFALGLLAIAVQGLLLSLGFFLVPARQRGLVTALVYCTAMGVYHWSGHVVAAAAKQQIDPLGRFFVLESFYLLLQFGLFGLALGWIHMRRLDPTGFE